MYVLVQKHEQEKITAGGIIVPQMSKPNLARGRVIEIGSDVHEFYKVRRGQFIFFKNELAVDIEYLDEKFTLLHIDEVLAWV